VQTSATSTGNIATAGPEPFACLETRSDEETPRHFVLASATITNIDTVAGPDPLAFHETCIHEESHCHFVLAPATDTANDTITEPNHVACHEPCHENASPTTGSDSGLAASGISQCISNDVEARGELTKPLPNILIITCPAAQCKLAGNEGFVFYNSVDRQCIDEDKDSISIYENNNNANLKEALKAKPESEHAECIARVIVGENPTTATHNQHSDPTAIRKIGDAVTTIRYDVEKAPEKAKTLKGLLKKPDVLPTQKVVAFRQPNKRVKIRLFEIEEGNNFERTAPREKLVKQLKPQYTTPDIVLLARTPKRVTRDAVKALTKADDMARSIGAVARIVDSGAGIHLRKSSGVS
jgi:hypothetical protein